MSKPSPCACIRVRRAARDLTHVYDAVLEPLDIHITQFSLLRNLERLGQASVSQLASTMGLDRSTLGRNLAPLCRRGLVLEGDAQDLRERVVTLSPEGRAVLVRAIPLWKRAQRRVENVLGPDGMNQLSELLGKLNALID
jgi:DNA-binding MarR family transcriptional regulator